MSRPTVRLASYSRESLIISDRTRVIGIFRNLLFTPLTLADDDDAALMERLPCLGSQAREKLYRLLLQLSEDEQINMIIIRLLSELVGEGT